MPFQKIRYACTGGVAVITLADSATMNAIGVDMVSELREGLARAGGEARAVLLTGEGRGFCSGANLAVGVSASGAAAMLRDHYNPLIIALRDLPTPLVIAVNGAAAGIGCSLALMGDLILAADGAYFVQSFRHVGLIPDGGATYLLARSVGRVRAMEMMMLGERISAAQALSWGMINRCATDAELMPAATALAHTLASGPRSLALIRKAAWAGLDAALANQLEIETQLQSQAAETADFVEGVAAFLQKRPPHFTGS